MAGLIGDSGMQYRSFICRNFHGDSPLEHRSGFALEANEMGVVLGLGELRENSEGKPRNFVCIDEFGKGTEDKQATAVCAASLKYLDEVLSPAALTSSGLLCIQACFLNIKANS